MPILPDFIKNEKLKPIASKVAAAQRITTEEALALYGEADLPLLGLLASITRKRLNGNYAYYNRNFHIEPTNICVYNCKFCSYHKAYGESGYWDYTIDEMLNIVKQFDNKEVTEVHIVGGVHPQHDLYYYIDLIKRIKNHRPGLHIKAFSAIELDYMVRKAGLSIEKGLSLLKEAGLGSIPGGGAEIFDEEIRSKICGEKSSSATWLEIHKTAHQLGIPSNATILYGHIENYSHRVDHLNRLRDLQDSTNGFNAFIPLKYKSGNNSMSDLGETSIIEDLRNYAVARIFLDNIPHIKAYWPMTGKELAQISLSFGTDDLDGTIDDTTKIYSMAGSEERNPAMSSEEIENMVIETGFIPVERDSLYRNISKKTPPPRP